MPDVDLLREITSQRREVERCRETARASAEQAKTDKAALKDAEKRLADMIDETIADRPLFDRVDVDAELAAGCREVEEGRKAPDSWRSTPITRLGLSEATLKALAPMEITTAGQLQSDVLSAERMEREWFIPETIDGDITDALLRLRHRLSNAQVEDFDGTAEAEKPKRGRKARAAS